MQLRTGAFSSVIAILLMAPIAVPAGASLSPAVSGPAISVVTSSVQASFSGVGQTLDFNFHVVNIGSVALSGIAVHDASVGMSAVSCSTSSLNSGAFVDCSASYVVAQSDVNIGSFSTAATVSGIPAVGPNVTSASSTATVPGVFTSHPYLGVAVSFTDVAPQSPSLEIAQARKVFAYVASLGANAVSIDFPFYLLGQSASNSAHTSSTIVSGPGTLSPHLVASLIRVAQNDGLRVEVRPLLSELGDNTVFTSQWRGNIAPSNLATWFSSYEAWLTPYLFTARQAGASEFSIGAELNSLIVNLRYWVPLYHRARAIFGPNVLYSDSRVTFQTIPGAQIGYDAYNPVTPPIGTTVTPSNAVSIFQTGILANFKKARFPSTFANTQLQEVGTPAVAGAWTQPYFYYYPGGTAVARWVQSAWLTANCNIAVQYHFAGIYFWALDFNSFTPGYNADTQHDPYNWEGTSAATALQACFASGS